MPKSYSLVPEKLLDTVFGIETRGAVLPTDEEMGITGGYGDVPGAYYRSAEANMLTPSPRPVGYVVIEDADL